MAEVAGDGVFQARRRHRELERRWRIFAGEQSVNQAGGKRLSAANAIDDADAGRDPLFRFLVAEMVIPAQVTTLPLFLMLNKVGLINTYLGVIVAGMATIYGIFLIRQFALSMYTLPVALPNLTGEHVQDTELMMAGAVVTILPVMIVFIALQKYYISGIMAAGLKE